MKTISGQQALQLMHEVSKLKDGCFTIAFYPYSRSSNEALDKLRTIKGCKTRIQLPKDGWTIDSENYLLFQDADANPKTCYRILIRYIGFPQDNFELQKVNWL